MTTDDDTEISGAYLDEPTEQLEPPRQLAPAILAIDIGGTRFEAGLLTTKGELVDRSAAVVDQDVRAEAHFDNLAAIVEQQLDLADRHDLRIAAVGVGCPGPITGNCETVSPVNLSAWREFPLRERLRELTAKRVYGDLDGKALALAEGWMGAAKGHDNYCVISVSTTIGGGVVLDGELLDGASTNAGHVGHLIVDPNGRRCSCGARAAAWRRRRRGWPSRRSPAARRPSRRTRSCNAPDGSSGERRRRCAISSTSTSSSSVVVSPSVSRRRSSTPPRKSSACLHVCRTVGRRESRRLDSVTDRR